MDIAQLDETWWFGTSVDGTRSGYFPAQYVALVEEPESEFESHPEFGPCVTVVEESEPELESGTESAPVVDEGIVAVALYECVRCSFLGGGHLIGLLACSYNVGEDNELSLREGDKITQVNTVTHDWWYGHDQYGNDGLFPGACICCAYL